MDDTIGLPEFLAGIRHLNESLLSSRCRSAYDELAEDYVKELLTVFEKRFSPCPLFFLSSSLPSVRVPLLGSADMPQIR